MNNKAVCDEKLDRFTLLREVSDQGKEHEDVTAEVCPFEDSGVERDEKLDGGVSREAGDEDTCAQI